MKDDTSAIPRTGCNVLSSNNVVTNYTSNTRRQYTFNGGKWILYQTTTTTGGYSTAGLNCIDVSTLNTNAQFEPLFLMCALGLLVFLIALCKYVLGGMIRAFR